MSLALRKADGDLFIDNETGRGEAVSGPTKVSQELFSLYTTEYDEQRNWGIELNLPDIKFSSAQYFRSLLYSRVNQANERLLLKQESDSFMDETEKITEFSNLEIVVDLENSAGIFFSTAEVGDPATEVGQALSISFKPVSTKHVVPPVFPEGLDFFKG